MSDKSKVVRAQIILQIARARRNLATATARAEVARAQAEYLAIRAEEEKEAIARATANAQAMLSHMEKHLQTIDVTGEQEQDYAVVPEVPYYHRNGNDLPPF